MIEASVKTSINKNAIPMLEKRVESRFHRTASYILKAAKRSIRVTKYKKSAPGQPPKTRPGGSLLKNSLAYVTEKKPGVFTAYIRSRVGIVYNRNPRLHEPSGYGAGNVGAVHEFGGTHRGKRYPKRPFLAPALIKSLPAIPGIWSRSRSGSGAKQQ